jgi:hypothetical protein
MRVYTPHEVMLKLASDPRATELSLAVLGLCVVLKESSTLESRDRAERDLLLVAERAGAYLGRVARGQR